MNPGRTLTYGVPRAPPAPPSWIEPPCWSTANQLVRVAAGAPVPRPAPRIRPIDRLLRRFRLPELRTVAAPLFSRVMVPAKTPIWPAYSLTAVVALPFRVKLPPIRLTPPLACELPPLMAVSNPLGMRLLLALPAPVLSRTIDPPELAISEPVLLNALPVPWMPALRTDPFGPPRVRVPPNTCVGPVYSSAAVSVRLPAPSL